MQLRPLFSPVGSPVRHGSRFVRALIVLAGVAAAGGANAAAGAGDLKVTVSGLRSAKGAVMACLTAVPRAFPECKADPAARHLVVPAMPGGSVVLDFGAVPAGGYALSVFHDENGNGKLDTVLMIPREGFGFSRDAPVHFGPPRFAAARFAVGDAAEALRVKMRYMF